MILNFLGPFGPISWETLQQKTNELGEYIYNTAGAETPECIYVIAICVLGVYSRFSPLAIAESLSEEPEPINAEREVSIAVPPSNEHASTHSKKLGKPIPFFDFLM